jgi:tetraacyldisaccharide 4'-kinase
MNLKQPQFWRRKDKKSKIITRLLLVFSLIYIIIFYLRKISAKRVSLCKNTITIGNIVIGGSGKTPTALKIKEILDKQKLNSVFLTRGYKGKLIGPVIVSNKHNIKEIGDEAKLLSAYGKVILAKKRHLIDNFLKNIKAEYLILDDGLQNPHIKHDTKIVVIDSKYLFGNKYYLPAGPVRSSIKLTLTEADIIILIGESGKKRIIPQELLEFKNKIFRARYKIIGNYDIKKQYYAFSALANNNKFFSSLKRERLSLKQTKSYPDHYYYSNKEIEVLIQTAKDQNLKLITTAKDMVKIDKKYQQEIIEFKIELELYNEERFTKKIISCLKK